MKKMPKISPAALALRTVLQRSGEFTAFANLCNIARRNQQQTICHSITLQYCDESSAAGIASSMPMKRPQTRVENLIKCGIKPYWAYQWGNSSSGYWRVAGSAIMSRSATDMNLRKAGYPYLLDYYVQMHKM